MSASDGNASLSWECCPVEEGGKGLTGQIDVTKGVQGPADRGSLWWILFYLWYILTPRLSFALLPLEFFSAVAVSGMLCCMTHC